MRMLRKSAPLALPAAAGVAHAQPAAPAPGLEYAFTATVLVAQPVE